MKSKNKNTAPNIVETTIMNVGFIAMTAASLLILAPEAPSTSANQSGEGHGEHSAHQSHGHERMEEIRHSPHSYGSMMRSPSTAGSL